MILMDDSLGLGIFGNVLNYDLSEGIDFGTGHIPVAPGANILGNLLDADFSHSHIDSDPLLINFAGNHHLVDYNMTLMRNRFLFTLKFMFASLFKRNRKAAMLMLAGLSEEEKRLIME